MRLKIYEDNGVVHEVHTTVGGCPPTRFNALKHGAYARPGVLPGEDPVRFALERRALFHTYRPQTKDEADLVDEMAKCRWVLQRYTPMQDALDAQALSPETDAAGRVSEPFAHQRLHSGMDVTAQRARLSRMWHKARAALRETQAMRCKGLVAGAVALPEGCYMDTDGEVYGPVLQRQIVPRPEPVIAADAADTTASRNSAIRENQEQPEKVAVEAKPTVAETPVAPPIAFPEPRATPAKPLRETTRGRLVGGFGARRVFLPPAPEAPVA
ncbi:MAG TPA: hypothetical protein VF678_09395 [bacterium]